MNNRVGLMVGRFQPLHRGHTKNINIMIQDCETAIVCIGSAQKKREKHDPWTVEERMLMIKNVYGERIKIVPLNDLGAATPGQWVSYILDKLDKLGMKEPTDYYSGSEFDASWYKEYFWSDAISTELLTRRSISMGLIDDPRLANYLPAAGGGKRILHILNRETSPIPSATEIRMSLELRNDMWKEWTSAVNHSIIMDNYPEEFKVPIK